MKEYLLKIFGHDSRSVAQKLAAHVPVSAEAVGQSVEKAIRADLKQKHSFDSRLLFPDNVMSKQHGCR